MLHEPTAILLMVAGTIGFLDALYFVLVTYRWMRPDPRWLPRVCRMDEATCARIVDTKYARLFGVPNSVFGVGWYGIIVGWSAFWLLGGGPLPYWAVFFAFSALTVLVSAFLIWALAERLRVVCVLCYVAHAVNFAIFVLLLSG